VTKKQYKMYLETGLHEAFKAKLPDDLSITDFIEWQVVSFLSDIAEIPDAATREYFKKKVMIDLMEAE
jgi:hypothetical protein